MHKEQIQTVIATGIYAYKKYEDISLETDPLKYANRLLFHLFVCRHLLSPITLCYDKNKYSFNNSFTPNDCLIEYKKTIANTFCCGVMKYHRLDEFLQIESQVYNKKYRYLDEYGDVNKIFRNTFSQYYDKFFNSNDISLGMPDEYVQWVLKKLPKLLGNPKLSIEVDFNHGMQQIVENIETFAKENKIKISKPRPINQQQLKLYKNNRILQLCFIGVKYCLSDKLNYETIHDELNIPYYTDSGVENTIIRKNYMKVLNRLMEYAEIDNLKEFCKKN